MKIGFWLGGTSPDFLAIVCARPKPAIYLNVHEVFQEERRDGLRTIARMLIAVHVENAFAILSRECSIVQIKRLTGVDSALRTVHVHVSTRDSLSLLSSTRWYRVDNVLNCSLSPNGRTVEPQQ
jgi:hypothetical protein